MLSMHFNSNLLRAPYWPLPCRTTCMHLITTSFTLAALLTVVACSSKGGDLTCKEAASILAGCADPDQPECVDGSPAAQLMTSGQCQSVAGKADWFGNRTWGADCRWNWQCQQDTKHSCNHGTCYRRANEGNGCDHQDDADCEDALVCADNLTVPSEPDGLCTASGDPIIPELGAETLRANETSDFAEHASDIMMLQLKAAVERLNGDDKIRRAFHAKRHACLVGDFEVFDGPADLALGPVFSTPQTFQAWVRMSNGTLTMSPDDDAAVQGLAIKLMNVPGAKVRDDARDAITQDFLMINLPANVVSNANEFMEFTLVQSRGGLAVAKYLFTHPRVALRVATRVALKDVESTRTENYWSANASRHDKLAVKYSARPCAGTPAANPTQGDDRHRGDIELALGSSPGICFDFYVQRQLDSVVQSVEDGSQVWDETQSVPVRMARITIAPTRLSDVRVQAIEEECNNLSFDPWNTVPTHQPLGHMNRARRAAYEASRNMRKSIPEPTTIPAPIPL